MARQTFDESGVAVTIIKYRCDGFTEEHWNRWKADSVGVQVAMNDRLSSTKLENDEGHRVYHLHMKMPLIISNRTIITTFYEHNDEATGFRNVFHSSQGNEVIIAARKDEIGSDVVANMLLTFMSSKPYEGGMEMNQVIAMDVAGRIPGMIKNKIAKKLSNIGMQVSDYMMHGTIPKGMF